MKRQIIKGGVIHTVGRVHSLEKHQTKLLNPGAHKAQHSYHRIDGYRVHVPVACIGTRSTRPIFDQEATRFVVFGFAQSMILRKTLRQGVHKGLSHIWTYYLDDGSLCLLLQVCVAKEALCNSSVVFGTI